jgi:hypothetical protein
MRGPLLVQRMMQALETMRTLELGGNGLFIAVSDILILTVKNPDVVGGGRCGSSLSLGLLCFPPSLCYFRSRMAPHFWLTGPNACERRVAGETFERATR